MIQRLYGHSTDSLSYQVAFKRFVDDVAVEAVETNLIAKLSDILSPIKVTCLTADVVTNVAGDPSRAAASASS